jgi:DNA primase
VARVPEAELERLKAEVALARLVEAKGVELKRAGADLVGRCPFHEDRTPSLVVTPGVNLWHCLGACQAGGSVIDWVMRAEGVSFRHAVELLRADHPLSAGPPVKVASVRKLPPPIALDAEDADTLAAVVGFYHDTLKASPAALDYLARRGLGDAELIDTFRLGYANRTLGYRLPEKNRRAGAELRSRLTRLGILRESGHEHFNGSLVVPVLDESGTVVELYGRKIRDDLRPGTPTHLYLPGPHRGVWNLAGVRAGAGEVIVCEALLDAMTLWVAGYRNVTAAYGVEGFTDEHLAAFVGAGVRRVVIGYDRDPAGDKAAVALAVRFNAAGIASWRMRLPTGTDVNEFATSDPPSAQRRLGEVIRKALPISNGGPPPDGPARPTTHPVAAAAVAPARVEAVISPPVSVAGPSAPPAARVVPDAPPADPPAEASDGELTVSFAERRWRVRGLDKVTSFDALRVNLLVADQAGCFHVDTLDLYSARARQVFVRQAADELRVGEEVIKRDLGRLLLQLEGLAEQTVRAAQQPEHPLTSMSPQEEAEALALLRDPKLLERVAADLTTLGVVGETTNKLAGYLAVTSRKTERPLAVIVQSSSAAGKSALMDALLSLVPEEDRVSYSAMTGQALYYLGETDLAHKVLAVVEEEGATRAAYALKLLQSEGELSIASTGKDPASGRLVTHTYRVAGPVAIFLTTTALDVDEELLNRCLVLTVDEDREQTRAIHHRQRSAETLAGLVATAERERLLRTHRNAQRLLRPLAVVNPYAEQLSFADQATRARRDHTKYLALIRTIALAHQYQRPIRTTTVAGGTIAYLEVTRDDIRVANTLAHEVLGRSVDELPPGTRRLLIALDALAGVETARRELSRREWRFTRRQLRDTLGWGDSQLKVHISRLVDHEYLIPHRAGPRCVYELAWDGTGADGKPTLTGLVDPDSLVDQPAAPNCGYDPDRPGSDANRPGSNGDRPGPGRGLAGGWPGPVTPTLNGASSDETDESRAPMAAVLPLVALAADGHR